MYCNLSKLLYHCFKCEAKGKIRVDIETTFGTLDKFEELVVQKLKYKPKTVTIPITIKENWVRTLPLSHSFTDANNYTIPGWEYLKNRGLSNKQIGRYCRVSTERSGPYQDTVIFPIYERDQDGLKYFVARRYTDQQPKYINAPWPKDDTLFVADGRGTDCSDLKAVIVEGIFDALAVERAGYCAYALLGKKATGQQLLKLSMISKNGGTNPWPFIIYLDDDALSHAIHLKMELETLGVQTVIFHHRLDAAALAVENMQELRGQLDAATEHIRDTKQ